MALVLDISVPAAYATRQSTWMPMGFGWARAVAPVLRHGGGHGEPQPLTGFPGEVWGPLGADNSSSCSAPAPRSQPCSVGTLSETFIFPN